MRGVKWTDQHVAPDPEITNLSTAISGHVEVFCNQQKSLDVGCCFWALHGQEVWDVHAGQPVRWRWVGGSVAHYSGERQRCSGARRRAGLWPYLSHLGGRLGEAARGRWRSDWMLRKFRRECRRGLWSLLLCWGWNDGGGGLCFLVFSRIPAGTLALAGFFLFDDDDWQTEADLLDWVSWKRNNVNLGLWHKHAAFFETIVVIHF